jgi:hypothetical protein
MEQTPVSQDHDSSPASGASSDICTENGLVADMDKINVNVKNGVSLEMSGMARIERDNGVFSDVAVESLSTASGATPYFNFYLCNPNGPYTGAYENPGSKYYFGGDFGPAKDAYYMFGSEEEGKFTIILQKFGDYASGCFFGIARRTLVSQPEQIEIAGSFNVKRGPDMNY